MQIQMDFPASRQLSKCGVMDSVWIFYYHISAQEKSLQFANTRNKQTKMSIWASAASGAQINFKMQAPRIYNYCDSSIPNAKYHYFKSFVIVITLIGN